MSPCERSFCSRMARKRSEITIMVLLITRHASVHNLFWSGARRRGEMAFAVTKQIVGLGWRRDNKRRRLRLFEFAARSGLVEAEAPDGDVGIVIVFAHDGGAGEAAEHGDLANVIEGVGDGSLKNSFS